MLNLAAPVGGRVEAGEVVLAGGFWLLVEEGAGEDRHGEGSVDAGLVDGDRIAAREHADIGDDGHVVLGMTVTVGRDGVQQSDVEVGAVFDDRIGILTDLVVQEVVAVGAGGADGVNRADTDTAATADAAVVIDAGFACMKRDGAVGTLSGAHAAGNAEVGVGIGLTVIMHLHLPGAGTRAHAEILDRAAEAGGLVGLEVVERDDDVGVHDGAADLRRAAVLEIDRDLDLIGAAQAVGDQDLTAGGGGTEAVLGGAVEMVEGVAACADVEGVGICQEGPPAALLDQIGDDLGILGTEVGEVAGFAEMNLDRDEAVLEINLVKARRQNQAAQFLEQVLCEAGTEVGEVDGG